MGKKPQTVALLVAAGTSQRLGSSLPKPYLSIGGQTLLRRTVAAFLGHPSIDGVRVVIRRDHHSMYKKATQGLSMYACVVGGETRQESVRRGLESLIYSKPEKVLIHDIARPMASAELIHRVAERIRPKAAVLPCLPVTDTVRRMADGRSTETIDRQDLFSIQTPQGFMFEEILALHRRYEGHGLSDDAALYEKAGLLISRVDGEAANMKITTKKDLEHMQAAMGFLYETRTGMGYDVHALKAHSPDTPVQRQNLTLCGIKIPHTHYLEGVSDADVGLHAIVDAILGSIAAGDIGQHFPPDDLKWQGADSSRFLMYAFELLKQRKGELIHVDLTLVCERPRISQYRTQMAEHIAALLKLSSDRISIKATTTEKLGFAGRGEGIAAQAVATVRIPRE
ncbi:MAG: bifunctional 2-C-methyl-D-erythritol 4-phosphate cytidylyltransferase/2-C-methyl-D-erythritol 2,4-cyclodiphosphate synthase [Alphaproteobacteria bacterium]